MVNLLIARNARWLGWFLAGLNIGLMGTGLALQVATRSPLASAPFLVHFSEVLGLCGFAIVGALIVAHHPRHPIGWLWLLLSFSFGLDHFAWGYAYYGYIVNPGSLPGVEAAIVWLYWLGRGHLGLLGVILLLLLFPTGRLLSRRWGIVAWIAVGLVIVSIPVYTLAPDPFFYFPFPTDLLAASDSVRTILGPLRTILTLVGLLCVLAAMFSLFLRLIKAKDVERQQIKWFVYAAAFFPLAIILISLGGSMRSPSFNWLLVLGSILGVTAGGGMPAASAIAIFRYRLWDIDLIIRRTLVYSILTAMLTLIYLGIVVLLQFLFGVVIGGHQTEFVTIVSTLASAALFVPLRRRVQNFIDRRFYRQKYDAERVLSAFSTTLRNEIDIDRLTLSFLQVVKETMQPTHVSFWLKEPPTRGRSWKET